jgi:DNA-binding CsgD family transcriptional regulator
VIELCIDDFTPAERKPVSPILSGGGDLGGIVGRVEERRVVEEFVTRLDSDARSLVIVGEAGIGKTMLWRHALARCREANVHVLEARPAEEDRHSPGQGLVDLLDGSHLPERISTEAVLFADAPAIDRARALLTLLRSLVRDHPVVIAVDDLPWLDDITSRALRYALRRLEGLPVALLATARTWSPDNVAAPPGQYDQDVTVLEVSALKPTELRSVIRAALPRADAEKISSASELAHGNPFFAIEFARTGSGSLGSPFAVLTARVAELPSATLHVARLLAVHGPAPSSLLSQASGLLHTEDAVRSGLDNGIFVVERNYLVRFSHPLISTAVLTGMHWLDRQAAHAAWASVLTDPDTRALHLAQATVDVDDAIAAELELAAERHAARGSPRLAAALLAHSVRLTPSDQPVNSVRRAFAEVVQATRAGESAVAIRLADDLLSRLRSGPLHAEVMTCRVVLDVAGAEHFISGALDELTLDGSEERDRQRGRLLLLLGWLLSLYQGRLAEGLSFTRSALDIGRAWADEVLIAQAAATVSTATLLTGDGDTNLISEAVQYEDKVEGSQLLIWPRVMLGRQQLWNGQLQLARESLERTQRSAAKMGTEFLRSYRVRDLSHQAIAAGDLERAALLLEDGFETAREGGNEEVVSWLAYPGGLVSALRGDAEGAMWAADRLTWWGARAAEPPRRIQADHIRGVLAAAGRNWVEALDHLSVAADGLTEMGWRHPGPMPVLPQAIETACLAGDLERARALAERLRSDTLQLRSPWVNAQLESASGQLMLIDEDPEAFTVLSRARNELESLGYLLDAARTGLISSLAGLRVGQRNGSHRMAEMSLAVFSRNGVKGWTEACQELVDRSSGASGGTLTATEAEVAHLVATGLRNREIGVRMFIGESTVEAHLTRIYRKLGIRNRAELIRLIHVTDDGSVAPA